MPNLTITEVNLRALLEMSQQCTARLLGDVGGYSVLIAVGNSERMLANSRGSIRLFSLGNAARFLNSIGMPRFEIDTTNFKPGRLRKARPDRAEAMRKTRTTPRQSYLL